MSNLRSRELPLVRRPASGLLVGLVVGIATLVVTFLAPAAVRAQTLPPNFTWNNIAPGQGLVDPVGVDFSSDGRIFVAEKRGKIQVLELPDGADINNGWVRRPAPFLEIDELVLNNHDRGMLGMVLDPDFVSNGHVYVAYSVETNPGTPDSYQYEYLRIERYTRDSVDPNIVDESTRLILVGDTWNTGPTSTHNSHTTGQLHFGSDGTLLFACGDGAHYDGGVDPGGRDPEQFLPGRSDPDEDVGAWRSQSMTSLSGRVIRIDPATGAGISSNPWYEPGEPYSDASRTWALGLRNPYRWGIDTSKGETDPLLGKPGVLYVTDVGWSRWEELNVCHGGENYGWPCYEGTGEQTSYQNVNPQPAGLECPPDASSMDAPDVEWPHSSGQGSSSPLAGLTGKAAVGACYYNTTGFPLFYRKVVFFGDYPENWIHGARTDANGDIVDVFTFATGLQRPIELKVDPFTGDLIYISWSTDEIRRIRYIGPSGAGVDPVLPSGLSASPGNAAVSLSWNPNDEADIVGYNVYRATEPGGLTTLLTPSPIVYNQFVDDGSVALVENGVDYYYSIEAVDDEIPARSSGLTPEVVALPSAKAWDFYVPVGGPALTLPEAPAPFPRDLVIPAATGTAYDHWSTKDYAPQLRRFDVPVGDWTLRTRITLAAYESGKAFHSGLIVAFGDFDLFYWGFYRGTDLRLERSGNGNLLNVSNSAETLELQVVKTGSVYSFQYRLDSGESWTEADTQNVSNAVQHVGWINKTWQVDAPMTVVMDWLALNELPPVASGSVDSPGGPSPHPVQFTTASFDPDGDILTHIWDFGDGNGSVEASPSHVYAAPGSYDVVLTVQDGSGLRTTIDVVTVVVTGNTPPTASVLSPGPGAEYIDPSASLTLIGSGSDLEEPSSSLSYSWTVDLYEGGVLTTPGYLGPLSGESVDIVPNTVDAGAGVYLEAILTVTDSQSAADSDTVRIDDHSLPPVAQLDVRGSVADGVDPPVVPGAASPWFDLAGGYDAALVGFDAPGPSSGWNGSGAVGDPWRLSFDGVDDVAVVLAGSVAELASPSAASVELWLRAPADVITRSYVLEWLEDFAAPFAGFTLAIQNGMLQVYLDPWQDIAPVAPDGWLHLVVVKDASGTRAFVDGASVLDVPAANLGPQISELVLGAGTYAGVGQYRDHFAGGVSELRVYDHALTPGNATVLHAAGQALHRNPPRVSSADPAQGPNDRILSGVRINGVGFSAGSGVELRSQTEPTIVASSVTFVGSTEIACDFDLSGAAIGSRDVVVIDAFGLEGQLSAGLTVTDPPIVVLELDGARADGVGPPAVPGAASPWVDVAGGLPAVLAGFDTPSVDTGWQGSGVPGDPYLLRFDGLDDRAGFAGGSVTAIAPLADYSVEMWFSPSAELQRRQILFDWLEDHAQQHRSCGVLIENGLLRLRLGFFIQDLAPVVPGQYHHVVVAFEGSALDVFVDGVPVYQVAGVSSPGQGSEFVMGASTRPGFGLYEDFLDGDIVCLRVHREGMDAAAVAASYAGDLPRFQGAAVAQLRLVPSSAVVGTDGPFTVDLSYDDSGQAFGLRGGSFAIDYDPSSLVREGASEGSFLSAAGTTFFSISEDVPGHVEVDISLLGASPGVDGSGVLASLSFSVAPAAVEGATGLTVAVDQLVDVADPPSALPHSASGTVVTVDRTPPAAAADLSASALHEGVRLAWTPPADADFDGVTLFYRPWTEVDPLGYPEYDDEAPAPGWPADLSQARDPGNGWTELALGGGLSSADVAFAGRSVLSVLVVARDAAGNLAELASAPRVRMPSYHLGDVGRLDGTGVHESVFDGKVDGVEDLPVISMGYDSGSVDPGYLAAADIGPTDTGTPDGVPQTDDRIDFEDLMIFSQDFGTGPAKSSNSPAALTALGPAPDGGALRLEAGEPRLESPGAGTGSGPVVVRVPLVLSGDTARLKGLHLELDYDSERSSYLGIERDDVLDLAAVPVLSFAGGEDGRIQLDLAALGTGAAMGGDGTLVWLRFSTDGGVGGGLSPRVVDARDVNGAPMPIEAEGVARESVVPEPRQYTLHPASPNPFNPRTTLAFELPRSGRVRLRVYDVSGRLVTSLLERELGAGYHSVVWDGTDGGGRRVSSGVYLYELTAPDYRGVSKMLLVK